MPLGVWGPGSGSSGAGQSLTASGDDSTTYKVLDGTDVRALKASGGTNISVDAPNKALVVNSPEAVSSFGNNNTDGFNLLYSNQIKSLKGGTYIQLTAPDTNSVVIQGNNNLQTVLDGKQPAFEVNGDNGAVSGWKLLNNGRLLSVNDSTNIQIKKGTSSSGQDYLYWSLIPQSYTQIVGLPSQIDALAAGLTLSGGATVTWNGYALKWSERVLAMPVAKPDLSLDGYYGITCPLSGTITWYKADGTTGTQTCTANGIPLPVYSGLYYEIPSPATTASASDDNTRFRLVEFAGSWSPNGRWLLLAVRNNENGVKWMPGQITFPNNPTSWPSSYSTRTGLRSWSDTVYNPLQSRWGANDAPLLVVLGQSNSYGNGATLAVGEQVTAPYANVLTLDRTAGLYSTSVSSISWVGLTTLGKHNIATNNTNDGAQDHVCNVANQFAKSWQNYITSGNNGVAGALPNLYVILMGWGGQGMDASTAPSNRWDPDRSASDVESLYPRLMSTIQAAQANLRASGKNVRLLGVHWNQWETDAGTYLGGLAFQKNLAKVTAGITDAFGVTKAPFRFYWPLNLFSDGTTISQIRQAMLSLVYDDPVYRTLIDVSGANGTFPVNTAFGVSNPWTGSGNALGIFQADNIHYTVETQKWFAAVEWNNVLTGYRGLSLPETKNRVPTYFGGALAAVKPYIAGRINGSTTIVGAVTIVSGGTTANNAGQQLIATATRNGVGDYTVTWATPHPNGANYGLYVTARMTAGWANWGAPTSTSVSMYCYVISAGAAVKADPSDIAFMTIP